MQRGPLGALVALLLWVALCCTAGSALAAQDAGVAAPPPPRLALGATDELALQGRSLYWFDERGATPAEQVEASLQQVPWRLRLREHQPGAATGTLWILFEASVPASQRWYLEVGTAANDRVSVFFQNAAGAWTRQDAGSDVPASRWAVPGRLPTFRLTRDSEHAVRYLVRIEDDRGDFFVPLALVRDDRLQQRRDSEQFLFGAYFGLLGLIAIASLVNGLVFGDRAFLALALYIALLGLGQLARIGLGAQQLWGDWLVWNSAMLALWPGAAVAAALWTIKIVTDPARLSRALNLAAWAMIAALLAATALHVVVHTRTSMNLVLALAGIGIVAALTMIVWSWRASRDRQVLLVAFAFLPVGLLAFFPLARGLGFTESTLLSRYGIFFGTLLELPLLYYALNARLVLRRETELRASALSRNDPLTGLPHRSALVERMDSSLAHARGQKQKCALLGVRIANMEAIAQEFGRDAVDKALVVAASHLRRATVGYDMPARVGEREFALLMEAPVTREAATSRAQQIVASGLRSVESLPGATLRFHVTVALLPRAQLDGAGAVAWVIGALDGITQDARKLIRSLDSGY
jgi:two-component system, sensor histidine kinase LadS